MGFYEVKELIWYEWPVIYFDTHGFDSRQLRYLNGYVVNYCITHSVQVSTLLTAFSRR